MSGNIAKTRNTSIGRQVFECCGVASVDVPIFTTSSPRMMTRYDPWVNMLRTTTSSFAAICGGADSICILPYDWRLERTERGRRMARNIHAILSEECRMDSVTDPAFGSYAIESMTQDYCERAWEEFRSWEREGGFFKGIDSCNIRNRLREQLTERQRWIRCGKLKLTGVSAFPNAEESSPPNHYPTEMAYQSERQRFVDFCKNRGEGPTIGGHHMSRLKLLVDEQATVLDLEGGLGF